MNGPHSGAVLRLRGGATIWQKVDNETIILDPVDGRYLGVNEAGTTLWSALARGATHNELAQLLHVEYEVPLTEAARDVAEFVSECHRRGYLAR